MIHWALLLLLPLAVAGCSAAEDEDRKKPVAGSATPTLHEMMTKRIDPDADAIWEIGNAALNAQATIDPKLMSAQNWTDLDAAATRMADHARQLAALDPIVVTRPGAPIADEGTPGAPTTAQIESHLQRDADTYRALAGLLATHVGELAKAAKAKDAATAGRLINEMDGVCERCHLEYWYPEQKAFVEEYLATDAKGAK